MGRDASLVSRRVSALEARLRVRLLERSTRRLAPTEAGALYHNRMRAALTMMGEAAAEVTQAQDVASGRLRLALPATFGKRWIAPALPEFLSLWPEVTIEAEFSDRFVDLIHERFDLAVRIGDLSDSRLIARRIAANDRIVVAAPDYLVRHGRPDTPEGLAVHACLANSRLEGYPEWRFRKDGVLASVTVTVTVKGPLLADDTESLVERLAGGK